MNQIVIQKNHEAAFNDSQKELIKNTYFKGSTDEEFLLFLHVCKKTGLDPILKQIHPVKRPTRMPDGSYKDVMTVQTGIDGYRLIAERTGRYSPGKEATFEYDDKKRLVSSTAYVKKQTPDGTWHEISAKAFYEEYCQKTKTGEPTKFWKSMPHGQLSKCAEALALRKAFPGDLSGLYTQEEMQQADIESSSNTIQVENKAQGSTISLSQAEDLENMLKDCSTEYQRNFWNFLKNEVKGIEKMEQLPVSLYTRIKSAISRKREENTILEPAYA